MSHWFWYVWIFLSVFVLSVYSWSLKILYDQKKSWKQFADKFKLTFDKGKMTGPPTVNGLYSGYRVYLYTDSEETLDVRGRRFITVLEIELGQGLPVGSAIGTSSTQSFLLSLTNFTQDLTPVSENWRDDYIIRTQNKMMLQKYLTEERLKAINDIFSMNVTGAIFLFDDQDAVVRIHASDPLRNPKKIEALLNKVIGYIQPLKISKQDIKKIWDELDEVDLINAPDEGELNQEVKSPKEAK
jgi:hypothetical protein